MRDRDVQGVKGNVDGVKEVEEWLPSVHILDKSKCELWR